MKVSLSNCEVELKDELTWWDSEEVKAVMASGARVNSVGESADQKPVINYEGRALLDAKVKLMERSIVSITENGETKAFSVEWLQSLSKADGDALNKAVNQIDQKK